MYLHSRLINFYLLYRCKVQGVLPAQKRKYPGNLNRHKLVVVEHDWSLISKSLGLFLLGLDCELSAKKRIKSSAEVTYEVCCSTEEGY